MKTQRQWDKFCVCIALVGGSLSGALSALPTLVVTLRMPMWHPTWNHDTQRIGYFVLLATTNILVRAPKRLIHWVFVPPLLWLACNTAYSFATRNWPNIKSDLYNGTVSVGIALVVTGGFALLTGKFGRGRERPDEPVEVQFQPQKGTWPPAPRQP